ncbi:hypothetical protein ACH40D_14165 [Streptomyces olivaceoviridis]|uniref:Uncharacterized protein n=1 Tax=Streptomyces olivaceoviridis TaxID=1921 RepID=A0ABW7V2V3_STROI|nr:hypothetical protein [Streptomyces corchorusii]
MGITSGAGTSLVACPVDTGGYAGPEAESESFRTDPPPEHLKAGDVCRVGVVADPAVHVTAADHHDPPLDTGWLPRPRLTASVPRRGLSYREFPDESHLTGSGYAIDGERDTVDRLPPGDGPALDVPHRRPAHACECCDRIGSPGR